MGSFDIKFYSALVALLVGLYTLYEKIVKPWRLEVKLQKEIAEKQRMTILADLGELKATITGIMDQVNKVSYELLTNGGSTTVRDKLTNITDILQSVKGEVDGGFYMSNVPRFISNGEGEWIAVNPAICTFFGKIERELLGYGWINCITDISGNAIDGWIDMVERDVVISHDYTINFDDGPSKIVRVKAVVNRDIVGKVKSVHGMWQLKMII